MGIWGIGSGVWGMGYEIWGMGYRIWWMRVDLAYNSFDEWKQCFGRNRPDIIVLVLDSPLHDSHYIIHAHNSALGPGNKVFRV